MPSFSAIIPNYNDGARIGASLASLCNQTRPYDEILIIDDGSTDDSVAIIRALIKPYPHVRLISNAQNKGVVATLNEALKLVTSDYVHMASSNDLYNLRFVEFCARALEAYPDCKILCGNALFWYRQENRETSVVMDLPQVPAYMSSEALQIKLERCPLTFFGGSLMLHRQAVLDASGLQESTRWHCDWMLYYLLAFRHGFYFVPEPMVKVVVDNASYSAQARIWSRQRPVIYAIITRLQDYPDQKELWKKAALLPTYNGGAIALLRLPECRWFVTPKLLWRIFIHSTAYWLKYYLPRPLLIKLRAFFRV